MRSGDDEQGSAGGTADAVALIPPRFRWLRRLAIAFGALVLCVALMRVGWGWYAQWRFDRYVAEVRARGEPALPEDFATMAMPPEEENAYVLLERAMAARPDLAARELPLWCIAQDPVLIDEYPDFVRELVQRFEPTLVLVQQAATAKYCVPPAVTEKSRPSLRSMGQTMRTMEDEVRAAAILAIRDGDSARGLALLESSLRIPEANSRWIDDNMAISGYRVSSEGFDAVCQEFASVSIARNGEGDQPGCASREQATAFIERMLDESSVIRAREQSVRSDRVFLLMHISALAAGAEFANGDINGYSTWMSRPLGRALFGPHWLLRAVEQCRTFDRGFDNNPEQNAAIVGNAFPRFWETSQYGHGHKTDTSARDVVEGAGADMLPGQVIRRMQLLGLRRMTATALAIRLFEIDVGRFPNSLDELVPTYLRSVPVDPFRPDGGPIGFLRSARTPSLVSVGPDQFVDTTERGNGVSWGDVGVPLRRVLRVDRPRYEFTIPAPVASTPRRYPDEDAVTDDRGNDDDTETEE